MPLQINPHPSALTWRFYRELKEDPDGDGFAANTGWSLRTMNIAVTQTPEGETRIKSLIVSVSIDRRASWVVKGKATASLLSHERQHYIFATLVAAELFASLLELRAPNTLDLQSAMRAALTDATARINDISSAYDSDTAHGTDAGEQARWETQVKTWQTNKQIVWP